MDSKDWVFLYYADALALFAGMACAMCSMYRIDASIVGLCVMFVGGMWAVRMEGGGRGGGCLLTSLIVFFSCCSCRHVVSFHASVCVSDCLCVQIVFYVSITMWNANHYSKQMVIDIQRLSEEEAQESLGGASPSSRLGRAVRRKVSASKLSMFDISKIQQEQLRQHRMTHNSVHPYPPGIAEDETATGDLYTSTSAMDGYGHGPSLQMSSSRVSEAGVVEDTERIVRRGESSLEELQMENDRMMTLQRSTSFYNTSPVQYGGSGNQSLQKQNVGSE